MTGAPRLTIAGGYGVFGRTLAREVLDSTPAHVVIAGRDPRRATRLCQALGAGERAEPRALDLRCVEAVGAAAAGCFALACTAGPFQGLDPRLPRAVAEAGCHWLDISDFSTWVVTLLADQTLHDTAVDRGVAVIPGLSTVPALSGAVVRWACERLTDAQRARVVLFIGNRNAKGAAAIASARMSGYDEPVLVDLPIGRRRAYRLDSPDEILLGQELGLHVEFRVALEWNLAGRVLALMRRRSKPSETTPGARLARWLSALTAPLSRFGSDAGGLSVEVFGRRGRSLRATLTGHGQRLAVLPCVLALEALLRGDVLGPGCVNPTTWLPPDEWLARLRARAIVFEARPSPA